jgi:hypothetical protein
MDIKRIIDREEVLQEWNWQSGINGGYCMWPGITCDSAQTVVVELEMSYNTLRRSLRGQLPAGSLLKGLPGLKVINFSGHHRAGVSGGINGPLQDDWSKLGQLQQVLLGDNSLSGLLPRSWSALNKLVLLDLAGNRLQGTLPEAWQGMSSLEVLRLRGNALEGVVPAAWRKGMHRLMQLNLTGNRKLTGCNRQRAVTAGEGANEKEKQQFWCKVQCNRSC